MDLCQEHVVDLVAALLRLSTLLVESATSYKGQALKHRSVVH